MSRRVHPSGKCQIQNTQQSCPMYAMRTDSTPVGDLPPAERAAITRATQMADEAARLVNDDPDSSPEFVTDDELFGPNDEADERLVNAAMREYGLDGV